MDTILQLIAILAVVIGTFFSVIGVVGYLRFPDIYTRLHATGKVGVFGTVLLLIATVAWTPLGFGKGLILILFLLVTGPVIAHAISSAAYRVGVPMQNPVRNDLATQYAMETTEQATVERNDARRS